MSAPLDGGVYDVGSDVEPQGDNNGNPAWQEFLEVVPQELHTQVTPLLEKWDKGVQERFQKVHSQYEPYKPIIDAGIDSDTMQFALNLLNSIEENPRLVYDALGNYHKFNVPDGNGPAGGQGQLEPEVDPQNNQYNEKFATLERQQQIMASHLLKQREAEVEAQEAAKLDSELDQMREKYGKTKGEFNEKFVLAMMVNGDSTEEAVQKYYEFRDAELKRHSQKPLIMGSGGALPHLNTDPRKLDDKGTRELAVQMLAAAAAQRNQ